MKGEALDHARLHVGKMRVANPLPLPHLGRDVPLDREIGVRDRREDLVHLGKKPLAIDRFHHRMVLVDQVRVQERGGRRQRDLETEAARNDAFHAQPAKHLIRVDGRLGVAEAPDADVLRPHPGAKPQARRRRRAAGNDRAPFPGARAFGRMGNAPARSDFPRVVLEGGVVLQHEPQARHP